MIKLVKVIDNYNDLVDILRYCSYNDDVVGSIAICADTYTTMKDIYEDLLCNVIEYMNKSLPSYYNASYPHCISTNIGPFGFSYMKDGLGMGINTRVNRKTGDTTFTLTFYYNKDKHFLKHNDNFNYCMEHDFELVEIENKKKKK